jgi:hypothetical protein
VRAYDIMGIDYAESKERFQEALDIILKPHPKIRIGRLGYPIFLGLNELRCNSALRAVDQRHL